jgi:hypothetical protein
MQLCSNAAFQLEKYCLDRPQIILVAYNVVDHFMVESLTLLILQYISSLP